MDLKKPDRLDRCSKGGGLLLFVRDDISCRLLTEYKTPTNIECIYTSNRIASIAINDKFDEW